MNSRATRTLATGLGLLALDCGHAPARRPVPTLATRSVAARPAPERRGPAPVWGAPGGAVFATADGARAIACGSFRVTDTRGAYAWADELFSAPVVSVTETEHGWVFATADGVVAVSPTFTGSLRVLGRIPEAFTEGRADVPFSTGRGRAVFRTDDGELFSTDGAAPVAPLVVRPGERVLAAAFVSARRGAAVLDGGSLWVTDDAGATWSPTTTPDFVAGGVMTTRGESAPRLVAFAAVATATDARVITAANALEAVDEAALSREPYTLHEDLERVRLATLVRLARAGGDGTPANVTLLSFNPSAARERARAAAPGAPFRAAFPAVRCELDGAPTPFAPWPAAPGAATIEGHGVDVDVQLMFARRAGRPQFAARWRRVGAPGAPAVQSAWGPAAAGFLDVTAGPRDTLRVLDARPEGVWLLHNVGTLTAYYAPARGRPVVITDVGPGVFQRAVGLAGGRVALLLGESGSESDVSGRSNAIVVLAPEGRVAAQRTYASGGFLRGQLSALGIHRGHAAWARAALGEPSRVLLYPVDAAASTAPESVASPQFDALSWCTDVPDATVLTYGLGYRAQDVELPEALGESFSETMGRQWALEPRPEGACARSFGAESSPPSRALAFESAQRPPRAAVVIDGDRGLRQRVQCTFATAAGR